jgi:prophage tail gpP-like protein
VRGALDLGATPIPQVSLEPSPDFVVDCSFNHMRGQDDTVTLKHLAMALAESHGIPKSQASAVLTGMVDQIAKHLKKGKRSSRAGRPMQKLRRHRAAA